MRALRMASDRAGAAMIAFYLRVQWVSAGASSKVCVEEADKSAGEDAHATAGREAGATPGPPFSCMVVNRGFMSGYRTIATVNNAARCERGAGWRRMAPLRGYALMRW